MIDIGKCPVCQTWVRAPDGDANPAATRLQCPSCSSEFPAAQWHATPVPALRRVSDVAVGDRSADDLPEPGSVPWDHFPAHQDRPEYSDASAEAEDADDLAPSVSIGQVAGAHVLTETAVESDVDSSSLDEVDQTTGIEI
ncbi:MAG: hypothetical protein KDA92_25720, partial [Planctomycetales bacterium]|nr:hypothetical protein [Planctomycetales bacterium]